MKRAIILLAVMAANLAHGQMFAQLFGGSVGTPIPAVAWYKLDGNALDSSGNGYDGTWTGDGLYSSGAFDGSTAARFSTTNRITADFYTGVGQQFSSMAWVNQNSKSGLRRIIISSTDQFGMRLNDGTSAFVSGVYSGSQKNLLTYWTSQTGTWYHVATTFSNGTLRNYINGVEANSLESIGTITSATTGYIGNWVSNAQGFNGLIDDVRIYGRALTPANIARIMTGQDVAPIEELQ